MKRSLVLSILCVLFSCQDYLKEESKSQMTLDYYYTDRGLMEGVAAVYSSCRELFRSDMFELNYFSDLTEVAASKNNSLSISYILNMFSYIQSGSEYRATYVKKY